MKLRSLSTIPIATIALLGLLAALSLWSGDCRPGDNFSPPLDSASADPSLLPAIPDDVAREVVKIQQQLGGSIVPMTFSLFDVPDEVSTIVPATADVPLPISASNATSSQTVLLRDSAWELDTLAHRFEVAEMYDQADALRSMATKLREDARQSK